MGKEQFKKQKWRNFMTTPQDEGYGDLISKALLEGKKMTPASSGIAPEDTVENIAANLCKEKGLASDKIKAVKLSIAMLAQEGATSPRFSETRSCSLFGVTVTVKELREECRKANTTVRRVARSLAPIAAMVGSAFDVKGNLAK